MRIYQYTVELRYDVMKWTGYFVSYTSVVITEEYNVMVYMRN